MSDDLKIKAKKVIADVEGIIDNVTIEDIKTDGIVVRSGNKILKLQVHEEVDFSIEDEIKAEIETKVQERMKSIKKKINDKVSTILRESSHIRMEAEKKERELHEKLKKTRPMPEITYSHAEKGLSVVKSSTPGSYIWLASGIYWPKTVNGKVIEPKYSKKLMSHVIFLIETNDSRIVRLSTRQPIGLGYFEHYHQRRPDCWGKFKPEREWKTPDDLIKLAREAEAVLENVNLDSIADRSPAGLPRLSTLERHVIKSKKKELEVDGNLNQAAKRSGMRADIRSEDSNVWSL